MSKSRLLFFIFLITMVCGYWIGLYDWPDFEKLIPLHAKLRTRIPILLRSPSEIFAFLILLFGCSFVLSSKFNLLKKLVGLFVFTLLMTLLFPVSFIGACGICFLILYLGLEIALKRKTVGIIIILFALACLFCCCQYMKVKSGLGFLLFSQVLLMTYACYSDSQNNVARLNIADCWILIFTFPGGLFSIFYGYKDFQKSFLDKEYSEIFFSGWWLLIKGFGILVLAWIIESAFYPFISVSNSHVTALISKNPVNSENAWLLSFVFLLFFVLEQISTLHIIQGVTRMLGYNVPQQVNNLFASTSFLDFWKRDSSNSRKFMMNYFFLPVFFRSKSVVLSNMAVWLMYSIVTAVAYSGLNIRYINPYGPQDTWMASFLKFGVLYFLASFLEMKLVVVLTNNGVLKKSKLWQLCFKISMYTIMVLVLIIGHELNTSSFYRTLQVIETFKLMLGF